MKLFHSLIAQSQDGWNGFVQRDACPPILCVSVCCFHCIEFFQFCIENRFHSFEHGTVNTPHVAGNSFCRRVPAAR